MKYLIVILILTGCSVTDAYTTAKQVNDDTFKISVDRFCGELAYLAANRLLSDAEKVLRGEFCVIYRARKD